MMNTAVVKDQEFIIISSEVTNAAKGVVTEVFDDESFSLELKSSERYSANEKVDLFAVSGSGVICLESELKSVDGKTLMVLKPFKEKDIQRREYLRVELNKNILIYTDEKTIRATVLDISAGGAAMITDTEMKKDFDYKFDITLEKDILISCKFRPIRVNLKEENKYFVSGKFTLIKNIDRVAIMQFCMKKTSENQNK